MLEDIEYEIVFIVIALILAYGLYDTVGMALGTDIPVVAVTSGSMEPALERGDLIIVRGQPFQEIEVSDVIVYQTEYMPVPIIHRVIERNATSLETKGDNNKRQVKFCIQNGQVSDARGGCPNGQVVNAEKDIREDQVLGTAFFVIPKVGHLKLVPTCLYLDMIGQAQEPIC